MGTRYEGEAEDRHRDWTSSAQNGSSANLMFEAIVGEFVPKMRGFELRSQGGFPDLQHRCRASAEFADFELALLDFLRQLDPTDNPDSGSETLEPQHRTKPLLHPSMMLFDRVIQVLAGPDAHSPWQFAILL